MVGCFVIFFLQCSMLYTIVYVIYLAFLMHLAIIGYPCQFYKIIFSIIMVNLCFTT